MPRGIAGAYLTVTVTPGRGGRSAVRADAQVLWYPPRTAAEYVDPARYQVVAVTGTLRFGSRGVLSARITSRAVITRLARFADSLPAAAWAPISCPAIVAPPGQLSFASSGTDRPGVVITATYCVVDGARDSGRGQPGLYDPGSRLARMVATLLAQRQRHRAAPSR